MEIEIKNAIIESASILIDDHGCLGVWLHLNYGGTGQGFGGHALYLPKYFTHYKLESLAGHHIYRILQIVDVTEWSRVVGKAIRVKADFCKVHAIGHIIKDDWFCPEEDYKKER